MILTIIQIFVISSISAYNVIQLDNQKFEFKGEAIEKIELIQHPNMCSKDAPVLITKNGQESVAYIGDQNGEQIKIIEMSNLYDCQESNEYSIVEDLKTFKIFARPSVSGPYYKVISNSEISTYTTSSTSSTPATSSTANKKKGISIIKTILSQTGAILNEINNEVKKKDDTFKMSGFVDDKYDYTYIGLLIGTISICSSGLIGLCYKIKELNRAHILPSPSAPPYQNSFIDYYNCDHLRSEERLFPILNNPAETTNETTNETDPEKAIHKKSYLNSEPNICVSPTTVPILTNIVDSTCDSSSCSTSSTNNIVSNDIIIKNTNPSSCSTSSKETTANDCTVSTTTNNIDSLTTILNDHANLDQIELSTNTVSNSASGTNIIESIDVIRDLFTKTLEEFMSNKEINSELVKAKDDNNMCCNSSTDNTINPTTANNTVSLGASNGTNLNEHASLATSGSTSININNELATSSENNIVIPIFCKCKTGPCTKCICRLSGQGCGPFCHNGKENINCVNCHR